MKKTLFAICLVLISLCSCNTSKSEKEKKLSCIEYFTKDPRGKNSIVVAENNKVPLYMQQYNAIKNNVVNIEVQSLTLTMGTDYSCKGYLTTEWTIKGEYFDDIKHTYLVECDNIKYNREYISWQSHWPEEHPFADE